MPMEYLLIPQLWLLQWKVLYRAKIDNLLVKNGGTKVISKHWAHSIMAQTNVVKRHGNTKSKVTCTNFEEIRELFIFAFKKLLHLKKYLMIWSWIGVTQEQIIFLLAPGQWQGRVLRRWMILALMIRSKLHMFKV